MTFLKKFFNTRLYRDKRFKRPFLCNYTYQGHAVLKYLRAALGTVSTKFLYIFQNCGLLAFRQIFLIFSNAEVYVNKRFKFLVGRGRKDRL